MKDWLTVGLAFLATLLCLAGAALPVVAIWWLLTH